MRKTRVPLNAALLIARFRTRPVRAPGLHDIEYPEESFRPWTDTWRSGRAFNESLRSVVLAISVVVASLATGCLSRPVLVKQSFAFTPQLVVSNAPAASDRVLGVRRLNVAAPFDGASLVYRTGEFSYEHDHYAEFLVSPAESLLVPIREYVRRNGPFHAVSEPGSALKPNVLLEISVNQLYGDFRQSNEPAAVLGIRFLFFDAPSGVPKNVLFEGSYSRRIPLQTRTAAALMAGWDQALDQVLSNAVADFTMAMHPSKSPESPSVSASSDRTETQTKQADKGR